ncbi:MAG: NUDIX hydrolase [Candidatus Uhrbacteria bacterium GW2011_GWE2_45_35]|uniref:NUDIX hydrolase n=2 Tax=Candidatus Uhriibacteriota TaxID=1752732 RepID=A0A0G1MHD7_9BACT|nr:MAG: NUDIX hydrolase [Candidatus Uhrbacteria bacterium GW2011_GWF2_44_350]KKU08644.1 MAG: NUDIX hydrolase [Candidatus Uhrbacteria bacterium GW2011_GWE2_45_35]HBR80295.1 ADP-ribose pyrophosphatase [Candidatus Uhrbacteria bacterium]HCU31597.1 ADP-ribose pyrophosphatase [Candidatus Uhrbacteria bacterium]
MLWQKHDEKLIRDGFRKILSKIFILPNGQKKDFEIKKEGDVVCVVPVTKKEKIILAKQFRPGLEKIFLELPGGGVEQDETPEMAVKRELLEETGYVGQVEFVCTIPICAYSTGRRHVFVATECEKVGEQKLDDSEFAEVVFMTLGDFRNHLREGQLTDVNVGYLGLDFLNLL